MPHGELDVYVEGAVGIKYSALLGKGSPYCILTMGSQVHRTPPAFEGGSCPYFHTNYVFNIDRSSQQLDVAIYSKRVFTEDDPLGHCTIIFKEVFYHGHTVPVTSYALTRPSGRPGGHIRLSLTFEARKRDVALKSAPSPHYGAPSHNYAASSYYVTALRKSASNSGALVTRPPAGHRRVLFRQPVDYRHGIAVGQGPINLYPSTSKTAEKVMEARFEVPSVEQSLWMEAGFEVPSVERSLRMEALIYFLLESVIPPSNPERSFLLFQLDETERHLHGFGFHDPTDDDDDDDSSVCYNAVHRKLYRALEQIETWCQDLRISEMDSSEFVLAKWREHFLEMLLALRWWTMVAALQAGRSFPDDVNAYEDYEHFLFSKRKGVLEVNNESPLKSSYERHFPSYGFEKWLQEPESRDFNEILQWKNILGGDEDTAKMALEVIRNASFPGFVIEGILVSYVDEAKSPLIEEEVTVDLTEDVLGVSRTGSWVIRTKCQGKGCALKRVEDCDREQPVIARLSHPHIVQLMHYWRKDKYLFLVMELMEGDLTDLLLRHKGENESLLLLPLAVDIMLQTAKGMLYLHDLDITYPLLNCSNVLFRKSYTSYGDTGYMIKLSEGGYSVKNGSSGRKIQDVYRFGLFCLEVLTGRQQYEDSLDIVAGTTPSIPEAIPPILKFCIASCLEGNLQFGFERVVTLLHLAEYQVLTSQKPKVFLSCESKDREAVRLNQHDSASPSTSNADLEKYPIHQLNPEPDVSDSDSYSASISSATLIFFHGFAKSPDEWKSTWMTRNREHVWPKAWLPNGLSPNVRILSVSYDSDAPGESQDISAIEIGKNLLRQLVLSSKWNLVGPIVLIGHSFGGLIIKSLVVETKRQIQSKMEEHVVNKCKFFLENLKSIVFYGVPGSTTEDQQFHEYIVRLDQTGVLQRSSLMQALLKDKKLFDQQMQTLCKEFEKNVPDTTKILVFIEGKGMRRIREKQVVVSEASARAQPQADFHLLEEDNHFEVCRPLSTDHKGYKILVEHVLMIIPEIGL